MGTMNESSYEIDGAKVSREAFYQHIGTKPKKRPTIEMNHKDEITHCGDVCRVVLRKHLISVGCSDVSPQALRHLLKRYEDHFGTSGEVVLQSGNK